MTFSGLRLADGEGAEQVPNAVLGPGVFHGQVIITWPKPREGQLLGATQVTLTDALTGEPMVAVLSMRLDMSWGNPHVLVAELVMLADENGGPATGSYVKERFDQNGEVAIGTFRFLVAEMQVAQ